MDPEPVSFHIEELGDDRFAAVWLDEDGAVHVQGFRFMADGSVELAGTRSTAQLLDAGAPGAWVERLRVTAGGIGDKLAIGADRYEDYSSPGTVHWAVASFDGEDWQFEVLPAVQVPAGTTFWTLTCTQAPFWTTASPSSHGSGKPQTAT
jgi:hypothetical protein